MKKLLISGVVLVAVLAIFIFLTLSNLGPLVKQTVNTIGPKITKTHVEVADVGVSVFSGEAKIKGFFLGNPKGFKSSQAMKVASIKVDIDEGSITKNPIIINKIEIIAPEITYEKISGSDNFQTLLKNIKKSARTKDKAQTQASSDGSGNGKKLVINNLILKDGKVNLVMAALGGKQITAPLPDIHLKDIGKQKGGVTPAQAFEQVFSSLYTSISADSVTQAFNDGLKQLGTLKDFGASGLQAGGKTIEKAAGSVAKGVTSAAKGIKNLFKKD